MEIFCSEEATLATRIMYAGIVSPFLVIWRDWVHGHPNLQLATNFITRETNIDALFSCHFVVMLICYMRDNFSNEECHLHLPRSDVLEDFWSKKRQ